jgi:hypothetical protein
LLLPTQRGKLIGNPDSFANDADVQSALTSLHTRAHESAELIGRITADLTVTTPVQHENAAKVAKRLADAAETTQRFLEGKAKHYTASSESVMGTRFVPNPARDATYMRCAAWIEAQAKNGDGGYTKIREAITDDPDFALTMYNTNWRLLGLPEDHAHSFKEKVVETYAPEALEYIDTSLKLGKLAKRYPAFIASVHSSFYSPIELAKVRTRVVV